MGLGYIHLLTQYKYTYIWIFKVLDILILLSTVHAPDINEIFRKGPGIGYNTLKLTVNMHLIFLTFEYSFYTLYIL